MRGRGAEPAAGEHGVPAPGTVPDDVGRRERGLRPDAARRGARRDRSSRRPDARARRPARRRGQARGPAVGRAEAARRDRAQPGARADAAAARRAARRAGPEAARAHEDRAEAVAGRVRHHLRLHHARPVGGAGAVRPRRGDEPRPLRAGRHAAGAVLRTADAVRGRLRRRQQPLRRPRDGRARAIASRSPATPAWCCTRAPRAAWLPAMRSRPSCGPRSPAWRATPPSCPPTSRATAPASRACCSTVPVRRCCCAKPAAAPRSVSPAADRPLRRSARRRGGGVRLRPAARGVLRGAAHDAGHSQRGAAGAPAAVAAAGAGPAVAGRPDRVAARRTGAAVAALARRAAGLRVQPAPVRHLLRGAAVLAHLRAHRADVDRRHRVHAAAGVPDRLDRRQAGAWPAARAAVHALHDSVLGQRNGAHAGLDDPAARIGRVAGPAGLGRPGAGAARIALPRCHHPGRPGLHVAAVHGGAA